MCGFVAGNIFKDTKHFHAALSLIDHRGRDYKGTNYNIKTNTYLGHNRLSIQGLTEQSNQPMIKDNFTLVYNGELWHSMNPYKQKFDLQTSSDTELLLNMFHLDQTDCIKTLDGMFGFAILDEKKNYLTFARDFMGRIPLYFFKRGKEIIVASELKAITNSLNINASDVILADPGCYYQFDYVTG